MHQLPGLTGKIADIRECVLVYFLQNIPAHNDFCDVWGFAGTLDQYLLKVLWKLYACMPLDGLIPTFLSTNGCLLINQDPMSMAGYLKKKQYLRKKMVVLIIIKPLKCP